MSSIFKMRPPRGSKKWLIVLLLVVIIILIVGGALVWARFNSGTGSKQKVSDTSSQKNAVPAPTAAEKHATELANSTQQSASATLSKGSTPAEASAVYDQAIAANSSDPVATAGLYSSKAQFLYNAGDPSGDSTLAAAQQAVALSPNYSNYMLLGMVYAARSDKPNALNAYKTSLDYLEKAPHGDGSAYPAMKLYLTQQITSLSGGKS